MLHSMKDIRDFQVVAPDGMVGAIDDFLFDDRDWRIRYLIARTGGWATARRIRIVPQSVTSIDWEEESLHIDPDTNQAGQEQAASFDQVNYAAWRRHDAEFERRYGHASYWNLPYLWEESALPDPLSPPDQQSWMEATAGGRALEPTLRSGREVVSFSLRTTDHTVGHIEDFLFEDKGWTIPMVIAETREWWPAKHVLIATARIDYIDWEDRCIAVRVTRDELESNPDFDLMSANPEGAVQDLYRRFWRAPYSR